MTLSGKLHDRLGVAGLEGLEPLEQFGGASNHQAYLGPVDRELGECEQRSPGGQLGLLDLVGQIEVVMRQTGLHPVAQFEERDLEVDRLGQLRTILPELA